MLEHERAFAPTVKLLHFPVIRVADDMSSALFGAGGTVSKADAVETDASTRALAKTNFFIVILRYTARRFDDCNLYQSGQDQERPMRRGSTRLKHGFRLSRANP